MKKRIFLTITPIVCAALLIGCKKMIDIGNPKNQIESSKVFTDSLSANSAVVGIYIDMMQSFGLNFTTGGITAYTGLSSDELVLSSKDADLSQFYSNQISILNNINASLWSQAYKYIYDTNACIEGINNSTGMTQSAKNQLLAESRQIRAFLYFNLSNLYGAVPLITSTDYHVNQSLPRFPVDSIYTQILRDLNFAQNYLPKNNQAERANFYSATAFLAKVQLYRKNYSAAEEAASVVINSGNYQLEPDVNKVFLAGSTEVIWKFIPVFPGIETPEGYAFVPSDPSVAPKFVISNSLFNSFENGDARKANWINVNTNNGTIYPYPFKYKATTSNGTLTENYAVLRLAEQYLIRAEARANMNNISGAQADLNLIRNRAGLANTTATNQQALLSAIEKERRSELFCEWGNRWFDLQRTNRANAIFTLIKPGWTAHAVLYPIPEGEIKTNPALSQNAGY